MHAYIWCNCGHVTDVRPWRHKFSICFHIVNMASLLVVCPNAGRKKKSSESNLQRMCYVIDDNAAFRNSHVLSLLNVLVSVGGWRVSWSFFVRHACPTTFKLPDPHFYAVVHCCLILWKSPMNFGLWHKFRPNNSDHWTWFFLAVHC